MTETHAPKRLVEAGFDHVAAQYLASKRPLDEATVGWLAALLAGYPATAAVLDLGRGAGVPITRWLAERATVTGGDVSAAMCRRRNSRWQRAMSRPRASSRPT